MAADQGNIFSLEEIERMKFNWEDLNGKTIRIITTVHDFSSDKEFLTVYGQDIKTNVAYVLSQKIIYKELTNNA